MEAVSQSATNIEQLVTDILSRLSPSDVIRSTVLRTCFEEFLDRGSPDDCWQLVPQVHRTAISTKYGLRIAPSNPSVSESAQEECRADSATAAECRMSAPPNPPTSDSSRDKSRPEDDSQVTSTLPSRQSPESPDALSPQQYFSTKGGSSARRFCLVRATQAILRTKIPPRSSLVRLWSMRKELFNGPESASRFSRLQRGREELAKRSTEYACARPLGLLFLAHEVDHLVLTCSELKLGRGRSRQTAVFEMLAEISGIELQSLKNDYWGSARYFKLLQAWGPGALLGLGSGVESYWEVKLSKDDVSSIIQYLEEHCTKHHKHAQSFDIVAARCIIRGLMAYGWTSSELLQSKTPLLEQVGKYVDIGKFSKKVSLKRRHGVDDGDIQYSKRQRTSCCTRKFRQANKTASDQTTEDQRSRGYSPSSEESNSSSESTGFSGSAHSAASTPGDATSFESDSSEPCRATPASSGDLATLTDEEVTGRESSVVQEMGLLSNTKGPKRRTHTGESARRRKKQKFQASSTDTPTAHITGSAEEEQVQHVGASSMIQIDNANRNAASIEQWDSSHLEQQLSSEELVLSDNYKRGAAETSSKNISPMWLLVNAATQHEQIQIPGASLRRDRINPPLQQLSAQEEPGQLAGVLHRPTVDGQVNKHDLAIAASSYQPRKPESRGAGAQLLVGSQPAFRLGSGDPMISGQTAFRRGGGDPMISGESGSDTNGGGLPWT